MARVMRYDGIPTTRTVREWRRWRNGWTEWSTDVPDVSWHLVETRERTVVDPIYVVPQMLPHPECGGTGAEGYVIRYWDAQSWIEPCGSCVDGLVAPPWPDYIATWQVNVGVREPHLADMAEWRADDGSIPDLTALAAERSGSARQVVAYKVTGVDELPAANYLDHLKDVTLDHEAPEAILLLGNGQGWHHYRPGTGQRMADVNGEPWAADLTPGRPVWRLHLEALDQTYTEMVCPCVKYRERPSNWQVNSMMCATCDGARRVPLSVPVGEAADIELVDPKEKPDGRR